METLSDFLVLSIDWLSESCMTLLARPNEAEWDGSSILFVIVRPRIIGAKFALCPYFPTATIARISPERLEIDFEKGHLIVEYDNILITEKNLLSNEGG